MHLEHPRKAIGTPDYEDDDVILYRGDTLELLGKFPPNSVPLTVTSPPYNIGKEYETILSIDEYISWTETWTKVHRITTKNGAFWLNLGYLPIAGRAKAVPIPYLLWDRVPFFLVQEIIWNYGAGVAGRLFFSPRNEKFLWYVKTRMTTLQLGRCARSKCKIPKSEEKWKIKVQPPWNESKRRLADC